MGLDGSVLDAVREQANGFARHLGPRDREHLDQYFTAVRELERKLRMNADWVDRPKPKVKIKRPQKGEVVAAGPGRVLSNGKRIDMEVKPGDIVIYSKYGGTEIQVETEELLVMGANDILAILS